MTSTGLHLGAIGSNAVHVAIDMQVYFARDSEWASPATQSIAPMVAKIAAHAPYRTVFTRFMVPNKAEDARGQWQHYYKQWASLLADRNEAAIYDLLPELLPFTSEAQVIDKTTHSAFGNPEFEKALTAMAADTLILSGVETDVCVLGTALSAIDRGYRTYLISDALASSDTQSHEATLNTVVPRFDCQIEVLDTATLLENWPG